MAKPPKLDHAVINVLYHMDGAQGVFGNLGFHLTRRGYHSLGSINHLMIFRTDYVELIGLPPCTHNDELLRPDITNAPLGINGLVFKTSDADETYAHLQDLGMAADPPRSFTRPVELLDATIDARFRTVNLRDGIFPAGRVYYCEHATPELVWRSQWQSHPNGALSIPEFVIASQSHQREAEDFARLLHSDVAGGSDSLRVELDGAHITIVSPQAYQERFGGLASSLAGRTSIFGALVIRTGDLGRVRDIATLALLPTIDDTQRVVIGERCFDCVFEFVCW